MRKLITLLTLLCCLIFAAGCFNSDKPVPNKPTQPVQTKTKQTLVVYRASADGRELLLPETIVMEDNGTAYADFSKELLKKEQGSYEQMMAVYAIVNTLTEYKEVKRVQILVEGDKVVSGHLDLEEPIVRNTTLLPKK